MKRIKKIKKKYAELMKIAPDSLNIINIYGTLLNSILRDTEKGQYILKKKITYNGKERKLKPKFVDEESGILLVSGNKETLGKVLYANRILLYFLASSEDMIKDCFLWQFIPKPFDNRHDYRLLKFVENCTSHHVYRTSPLFMCNQHGFLVECYFNLECIGHEGKINFLAIVEPIIGKNREVALIGRHGEIFCHSEKFAKVLGCKEKHIEDTILAQYIPDLVIEDLPINTLYTTILKLSSTHEYSEAISPRPFENSTHKEIGLIVKEKTVVNTVFYTVYISDDESEIIRWKSKKFKAQDEEFDERLHEILTKDTKKNKVIQEEIKDTTENIQQNNDVEKEIHQSSTSLIQTRIETKALKVSLRSISAIKISVFLSVLFM